MGVYLYIYLPISTTNMFALQSLKRLNTLTGWPKKTYWKPSKHEVEPSTSYE